MSHEILNLEPKEVWKHFYSLTQIPRPSGHEDQVEEFMINFGKSLGLVSIKDEVGNIIIKKPATPGFENRKGIILQGHLDMVPQKNSDTNHDFTKDPIQPYIDGEWVKARGTTLGADNGIGVAAAMAVLASKTLQHGPVEGLFTSDEETGMTGAFGLKSGLLDGDILLNIDSEDEGELYIGCAGGIDASIKFTFKEENVPANCVAYKLSIKGLKGGHSGLDIILGRANSNKLLFRFLKFATKNFDIKISDLLGGSLRNAIPRESFATIVVSKEKAPEFESSVKEYESIFYKEYHVSEPDLKFIFTEAKMPETVMDNVTQMRLIQAIYACPNGVMRMSDDMPGMVETSNNLAIVKMSGNTVRVASLLRSSVETAKDALGEMVCSVFELAGAEVELEGGYPGWKPNPNSEILTLMQDVYNKKFGKIPEIKAIHAGLECGLLGSVYPHWDMISFGPTMRFPHSPDEKLKIDTVEKFWIFLTETLKAVPIK
jgi:dipeptidase D